MTSLSYAVSTVLNKGSNMSPFHNILNWCIFQVDNLKYEHDKLQKKGIKQNAQVEKERDQVR